MQLAMKVHEEKRLEHERRKFLRRKERPGPSKKQKELEYLANLFSRPAFVEQVHRLERDQMLHRERRTRIADQRRQKIDAKLARDGQGTVLASREALLAAVMQRESSAHRHVHHHIVHYGGAGVDASSETMMDATRPMLPAIGQDLCETGAPSR